VIKIINLVVVLLPLASGLMLLYVATVIRGQRRDRIVNALFWFCVLVAGGALWLALTEIAATYGIEVEWTSIRALRIFPFRLLLFLASLRLWWEFR